MQCSRKFFVIVALMLVIGAVPARAQVSLESELGSDGKGHGFFSQYVFYDFTHANVLTRYFWVNRQVHRGEFALGPTVRVGKTSVRITLGATTDREVMVGGTVVSNIRHHEVTYIADGKLSTTDSASSLYQKLFVSLDAQKLWQFRVEDLQLGSRQDFLRIGAEYRMRARKKSHIYLAPFFDPIVKEYGGQIGYRYF